VRHGAVGEDGDHVRQATAGQERRDIDSHRDSLPAPARHKGRGWDVDVSQKAASGTLIQGVTIEEIGERGTEILRLLQLQ
jgi:hypothetical protein